MAQNNHLRVGYVPYQSNLQHPDDRRRFPYYAKRRAIPFEIARFDKKYDLIVLPACTNLSGWLAYKEHQPNTRFVFEMVDSLIYQNDFMNTWLKGPGRYVTGRESRFVLKYKSLLFTWLKTADVVLASSPKLCSEIEKWNRTTLLSLDYLDHEYQYLKTDYSASGKIKLIWEGQGVVLPYFYSIKDVLQEISSFCELHIVTSATYPTFGPLLQQPVAKILEKLPIDAYYHPWSQKTNAQLFASMDLAIIPLDVKDQFGWHKPANKLLSFWFSGLPVLCSATPAYQSVARESGADILCNSKEDWVKKIKEISEMKADERQQMARTNYDFVKQNYGSDKLDEVWDTAFQLATAQTGTK